MTSGFPISLTHDLRVGVSKMDSDRGLSTVDRVFSLHVAHLRSIPGILYGSLNLSGIISELRGSRSNSCVLTGVVQNLNKKCLMI